MVGRAPVVGCVRAKLGAALLNGSIESCRKLAVWPSSVFGSRLDVRTSVGGLQGQEIRPLLPAHMCAAVEACVYHGSAMRGVLCFKVSFCWLACWVQQGRGVYWWLPAQEYEVSEGQLTARSGGSSPQGLGDWSADCC
jgi:hypothetical protein